MGASAITHLVSITIASQAAWKNSRMVRISSPGSRVIAAQKAYTSNNFSLPKLAMATANLYSIAQPGGFAFGIQESNPITPERAYAGPTAYWGQPVAAR